MEDYKQLADQMADRFGVSRDLFRGLIQQESGWNPQAQSRVGAFGLTQVMPATAKQPGYGVRPMQSNDPQEQLRFGAEYLSKMLDLNGGDIDKALASYNAGYGAVLKAGGVPAFKETQDYVQKVKGYAGLAEVGPPADLAPVKQSAPADPNAIFDAVVQRQAERAALRQQTATAGEAFEDAVHWDTLTGAALNLLDSGKVDPNFTRTQEMADRETAAGIGEFEQLDSFVKAARSQEDWQRRMGLAQQRMEFYSRAANNTGWEAVKSFFGGLGGSIADPLGAGVGGLVAAPLSALRMSRATLAASRLARVGAVTAEAGLSNGLLSAAIQDASQTEVSWGRVFEDTIYGAAFGIALSAPAQARMAAVQARDLARFDAETAALGEAIDTGAPAQHVTQLQANIDAVKASMVQRAAAEGDELAATLWAQAGPGARAADVQGALKALRARQDAAIGIDPVAQAEPTRVRTVRELTQGEGTVEVQGMRLSREASAVRDFAYNVWREDVDPLLADMQARMRQFYEIRKDRAKEYAGLAQWLDSPGLILQNSQSKVARMLGAHLFESASGLGKREQTAALNYEMLHSRLAHGYIPELKDALREAMKADGMRAVAGHIFGGSRRAESEFWKQVARERMAHRAAIRAKQQWQSTAPAHVQKAARALDKFWGEAASHLERVGVEEGAAIRNGGVVGHMPYRWDNNRIAQALREDPEAFAAFKSMLQDEYRQKLLTKSLEDLGEHGEALMKQRQTNLEGDIAAVQDEIAKLEGARRQVDQARDVADQATSSSKELNDLRTRLLESERTLKEELKAVKAAIKQGNKDLADAPEGPVGPSLEEAAAGIDVDLRPEVGEIRFRVAGGDKEALRNDPSFTEVTAQDLIGMVKQVKFKDKKQQRLLHALADALSSDFGEAPMPVFLTGNALDSHYWSGSHHMVLSKLQQDAQGNFTLTPERAGIALHELAHGRTSRWLRVVWDRMLREQGVAIDEAWGAARLIDVDAAVSKGIPKEVAEAWNKLESLRGALLEKFPGAKGTTLGLGYALKNSHELMSQVFNDEATRTLLNSHKIDGGRSVLRTIWEAVAGLLGLTERTGLTEVVEAIDAISKQRGTWQGAFPGITSAEFGPAPKTKGDVQADLDALTLRQQELTEQLAELAKQKADIDAQRKQAGATKKQALAQRKEVMSTENAQKLKNLRLQLDNRKAQLADMQRDPLGWWAGEVEKLRNAANAKADALSSSYLQQVIQDPRARAQSNFLHMARLAEDLLQENWSGAKVTPEVAEDFSKLLQERLSDRSRTEFDLGRTVPVNGREVSMLDFMELDGLSMVKSGSHRVSGQVALAKMGIGDAIDAEAAIKAAETDGATPQEMQALRFGIDFMLDRLEGGDPALLHAMRNLTYATRMGKLGVSVIADVPQLVSTLGMGLGLKVWGQSFLQLSLTGKKSYASWSGKATEFAEQLGKIAPGLLGRDHRLMTLVPDDPATGAADLHAASLLQRMSARGAQMTSFISGANSVTMAMHRALLPVLAEEMLAATKGASKINAGRLADAGLTPEWLARIKAQMDQFDKGRRKGDKVNWNQWTDQEAADQLIAAMHRAMFQTLQKSLVGEKPQWMATSAMGRLIGQFRSFGLTAAEKQSARQLVGHQDSGAVVGAVMGIVWAGLMYYARVHMNAAGRDDREEYIAERLTPGNLALGVMTLWNLSGIGADVLSVGGLLFGGNQQVQTAPAAVLGYAGDVVKAAQAPAGYVRELAGAEDGGIAGAEAAKRVIRMLPGSNSIPITVLLNELAND